MKHVRQKYFFYSIIKLVTRDEFILFYILRRCNGRDALNKEFVIPRPDKQFNELMHARKDMAKSEVLCSLMFSNSFGESVLLKLL
jgi:hypothetical protein